MIATSKETHVEINRLKELKQLKQLANSYLNFYLDRQNYEEKTWEKKLSKRNIALLKSTIAKINKLQHDDKIAEYLEAIRPVESPKSDATKEEKEQASQKLARNFSIAYSQGPNLFLLMEINKCSPRLSYFNDLTWFKHGDIMEHLEYGIGKIDETVFEKYLPYQIDRIKETKNTFFSKDFFKDDLILLEAILPLIEEDKFIPANILIITLIEGIVRKFALNVYKKQNQNVSDEDADAFAYVRNRSLESLIESREWKKDIPITFSELLIEYAHVDHPTVTDFEDKFKKHKAANERISKKASKLQNLLSEQMENRTQTDDDFRILAGKHLEGIREESKYLMGDEDKTVKISMNVFLDFLSKKFKDDRNNIIHGKYSFFKEKWRTLVYLTALQTLIEKILWHEKNVTYQ